MFCDSIIKQNHVNVVVKRFFLLKRSSLLFHPREMILSAETTRKMALAEPSLLVCRSVNLRGRTENPMNHLADELLLSCMCEHSRHKTSISDAHNVNMASTVAFSRRRQ